MSTARLIQNQAEHGKTQDVAPSDSRLSHATVALLLLAVTVLFGVVRYRLRDMPLERDARDYRPQAAKVV